MASSSLVLESTFFHTWHIQHEKEWKRRNARVPGAPGRAALGVVMEVTLVCLEKRKPDVVSKGYSILRNEKNPMQDM